MKILFADPIGHVLGHHDQRICRHLSALGHSVILATNEQYPFIQNGETFRTVTPFRSVVGEGSFITKGWHYIAALARLAALTGQFQPDVLVYYYILQTALDHLFLAFMQHRTKTLLCVHDVFPLKISGSHRNAIRFYRDAPALLTFGGYARRELISAAGVSENRVHTLFLPTDCPPEPDQTHRAAARARFGLAGNEPVILCFGQIKQNKGLEFLLPAFAGVLRQVPAARLLVVGRPWKVDVASIGKLACDLHITDRFTFRPELVPEEETHAYMQAADVVVLPYTHLYQSAVLPFACSMGKPLVATRVGSNPEILQDGVNAWLVPPGDIPALEHALVDAVTDPAGARARGAAARQLMQDSYTWELFGDALSNILARISEDSPR